MLIKKLLICVVLLPMAALAMDPGSSRKRPADDVLEDVRPPKHQRFLNVLDECICDARGVAAFNNLTCANIAQFQNLVLEREELIDSLSYPAREALPSYLFKLLKSPTIVPAVVDTLVRKGINLADMRNDSGQTLLHQAVGYSRYPEVIEVLAACVPVDHRDEDGETALHIAAQRNHSKSNNFVAALLEAGANPNVQDGGGNTPLHDALNSYKEGVSHLLIGDLRVNCNIRNFHAKRPIDIAVAKAIPDSLRLLLIRGDVDDSGLSADTVEYHVPGEDFAEVSHILQPEIRRELRIEHVKKHMAPGAEDIISALRARSLGLARRR